MRAGAAFMVFAVLAVAPCLSAGPASGLPPGPDAPPALTVTFEETGKQAAVSESSYGNVTFDGSVALDALPRDLYNVTLSCNVDTGWTFEYHPVYLLMSGGSRYSFQVEVTVPQSTSALMVGTLSVRANATGHGYSFEATGVAKIHVIQYYRVWLDPERPYIEAPPSTPVTFTMKVTNAGNGPDGFRITLANRDHLYGQGWTVDIVPDTLTGVPSAEFKTTEVTVTPPHEWVLWKAEPEEIVFRANSTGALSDQQMISIDNSVYLYQRGPDPTTLYSLITLIVLGVLALSVWAVRRRRARRRRPAPPKPDEPIDVEPY